MTDRKFITLAVLVAAVVIPCTIVHDSHRAKEAVKKAEARYSEAKAAVPEQAKAVQEAVERWALANAGCYPCSLDDINGAGQTVVDLLPNQRRFLNAFHSCPFSGDRHHPSCYTEPRNWSRLGESGSVITAEQGAIYYCPMPDGSYFIRAYNASWVYPTILAGRR